MFEDSISAVWKNIQELSRECKMKNMFLGIMSLISDYTLNFGRMIFGGLCEKHGRLHNSCSFSRHPSHCSSLMSDFQLISSGFSWFTSDWLTILSDFQVLHGRRHLVHRAMCPKLGTVQCMGKSPKPSYPESLPNFCMNSAPHANKWCLNLFWAE